MSGTPRQALPIVLLLLALAGTAAVTLRPVGDGWAWGAPADEVQWYLGGLDSPATVRQLLGNLLLLAPAAAAAVLCVPRLAGARRLVTAAVLASLCIEGLQWLLPLGRVVSPTDGVLNASGAVLAGLLTARLAARAAAPPDDVARPPVVITGPPRSVSGQALQPLVEKAALGVGER